MILEDAPGGNQAGQAAAAPENTGDFGYKSSAPAAPAEPNASGEGEINPDAAPDANPKSSVNTQQVAPEAPKEGAADDNQSDDDNWFSIPGSDDNNGNPASGAPAKVDDPSDDTSGANPDASAPANQTPIEWRQLLKEVPREELLKELGIEEDDDFLKNFKKHMKNGGDPVDYLEARSRDWTKVDDTSLAMQALAEQNPTLNKEELDLLFEETYFQDEDATDREKELGKIKIKTDADRKRRAEIEKQKQFTIPDKPLPAADEETILAKYRDKYIKEAEETVKADNKAYMADPTTQEIIASKKVTVPLGKDGKFTIGVDPKLITGYFTDPEVYAKYQFGEGGKPDMKIEQALAAIRIMGLENYNSNIVSYAKAQAKKELLEEGQNISNPGRATPPPASKGPVQWRETGGY